jgi:hypothetical protein
MPCLSSPLTNSDLLSELQDLNAAEIQEQEMEDLTIDMDQDWFPYNNKTVSYYQLMW